MTGDRKATVEAERGTLHAGYQSDSSMREPRLKDVAGALAIALLVLAGAGLAPAHSVGLGADWFAPDTELPICGVGSFAVDLEGNIYLEIGTYNHIQKYDARGRFVTHWPVPAGSGTFALRASASDTIEAIAWRKQRVYTYAPSGALLRSDRVAGPFDRSRRIITSQGVTYRLASSYWWPTIHRRTHGGPEEVVVSTRLSMWLFAAPFPALAFASIGVALLGLFLSPVRRP
jgi:hypothetical protein